MLFRGFSLGSNFYRYPDKDSCAFAARRFDFQVSAEQYCTFAHADQAEAVSPLLFTVRIKPDAIVLDDQQNVVLVFFQQNADVFRFRVLVCVVESFLYDAI